MRFGFKKYLDLKGVLLREAAISKLRKSSAKCKTIDDHVDLAFSFKFGPFAIRPIQGRWEILQLMKILRGLEPKTILEIGTAGGGTLYLWSKIAATDSVLISIDLPKEPFGRGYPEWKAPFYQSFGSADKEIHLLRMDSHNETTLNEVERILKGRKVDFLFIDGDHSYKGVKKDFEMYGELVRQGGIIAFHDIVLGPYENVGGVPDFWNKIKQDFRYEEIVEDWNQKRYGIGIIQKG